ncbi:MBL fold metallo-hydrolase RNA specificity domain-containing protein [candidate division CSSED10-310 bacterium]|uniref:MBL fold metallo-hydrolase RNA specificity domain-containing protein n=1 Tax=candidate division CSSED10-310 bacterium TaxID=2855610 RepID=A0ABV6Z3U9_UNCC1
MSHQIFSLARLNGQNWLSKLFLVLFFSLIFHGGLAAQTNRSATIGFYGAAGSIGGSCHLLDTGTEKILLDCGAYMERDLLYRNNSFPFLPSRVHYVALSHAHIDHAGRLPVLINKGFWGTILCAPPSKEIANIMLNIQHLIHRGENRYVSYSRYDIKSAVSKMREVEFGQAYTLSGGSEIRFFPAQHILGASMIHVTFGPPDQRKTLLFTGDFGNEGNSILSQRPYFEEVDYLIIESTYGGKNHGDYQEERQKFYRILRQTADDGGITIIPSFVLARTQKVLGILYQGMMSGMVNRDLNVYVDSPSASKITRLYAEHPEQLAPELQGGMLLDNSPFTFRGLHLHKTFKEIKMPAVVIAPSADASSGKIISYLKRYIERSDTRICFVSSYQAPGTVGEKIAEGAKEVMIDGEHFSINAKVYELGTFSGHGDQKQIFKWLKGFKRIDHVYVVHGVPPRSQKLAQNIRQHFKLPVTVAKYKKTYRLSDAKIVQSLETPQDMKESKDVPLMD